MWREVIEEVTDLAPCCLDGALGSFSQEVLEFGEDLLDRVEVRAVGRQVEELGALGPDGRADGWPFVAAEIVHDDDIAGRQRRGEELFDPRREASTVDRPVKDGRGVDAVRAQGRHEGQRAPVSMGNFRDEPLATRTPATERRHVGLGPGFVDEDQAPGIKASL